MNILVTGAEGFVGRNLCAALHTIRDGKDRTRPHLYIREVMTCDRTTSPAALDAYCARADFVYHLAGVNRASNPASVREGNIQPLTDLLDALTAHKNACPVLLASSTQAACIGRYDSAYGQSKRICEEKLAHYGQENGAEVFICRFPNVFGKWCPPDAHSVVATFCYRMARDLPIVVHDPAEELDLLYIDDLVAALLDVAEGKARRCRSKDRKTASCTDGPGCILPPPHRTTVGALERQLRAFRTDPVPLTLPDLPDTWTQNLYSTYISYLPPESARIPLCLHSDPRGSFVELFRPGTGGQISVNITAPGAVKGRHWHHSKVEVFVVVSGHGQICQRKLGTSCVQTACVSGDRPEAVFLLPGYTHELKNLSDQQELVTVMWADRPFDPARPDTYPEEVACDL